MTFVRFAILLGMLVATPVRAADDLPRVPSSAQWIYVFIQDPHSLKRGSGREVATMATTADFLNNFDRYRDMARQDGWKLIVTAESSDGQWVQQQISYRGQMLKRAPYYNPGLDAVRPGAEIPVN